MKNLKAIKTLFASLFCAAIFIPAILKAQNEKDTFSTESPGEKLKDSEQTVFEKFNAAFARKVEGKEQGTTSSPILYDVFNLANERREALIELAKKSPGKAMEEHFKMLDNIDIDSLPDNVKNTLEKEVSGIGDLYVISGDDFGEDGKEMKSFTQRWIEMDGNKYNAAVYGMRANIGCKKAISIDGILIGETIVLYDKPARILKDSKQKKENTDESVIVLFQGKKIKFNSEADALKFQNATLKAEKKPGTDKIDYPLASDFNGTPLF